MYAQVFERNSGKIRAIPIRQLVRVLILIYRGPWLRRDSRIRPVGRAAGCRAFFDQHKDVLSKNPAKHADPARSAGRNRRGVLSLGHSFFAQATTVRLILEQNQLLIGIIAGVVLL
jgi:hypothetical protein